MRLFILPLTFIIQRDLFVGAGTLEVSVTVTNTGKMDGEEVAQLYLRDVVSTVTTPILALKDFQRVLVKAGASEVVKFSVPTHSTEYVSLACHSSSCLCRAVFTCTLSHAHTHTHTHTVSFSASNLSADLFVGAGGRGQRAQSSWP